MATNPKLGAATILVVLGLLCFAAGLLPAVPEKYVHSVGGILLAAALLVGALA
jgi:hypothetical protein